MKKIGLVIEGGGFRGIYTAGILDYFLDQEWHFPYVIGISMGACNAANYISKQYKRSLEIPYSYLEDSRYISYRNLITQGSLFGMDFIFNDIPNKYNHFDFKTARESKQTFVIGAMDVHYGGTKYFYLNDLGNQELLEAMKASCSLPLISKMVQVKGKKYLDGGLSSSIPLEKAMLDGMDKVIVLLTREEGYIKKASSNPLVDIAYYKYPKVVEAVKERHEKYNKEIELVTKLSGEGKVLAIYPNKPIDMGRVEKNKSKLKQCYLDGYARAKEMHSVIEDFIKNTDIL